MHFNIKRTIGIFVFNINIKTNTFAVSTSFNGFFAFRIADAFNFDVKNVCSQKNDIISAL